MRVEPGRPRLLTAPGPILMVRRPLAFACAAGFPHSGPLLHMPLTDLVAPHAVVPALKANSKKQAIQELAARAAELTGQGEREILEILKQREKLGSTRSRQGNRLPPGQL